MPMQRDPTSSKVNQKQQNKINLRKQQLHKHQPILLAKPVQIGSRAKASSSTESAASSSYSVNKRHRLHALLPRLTPGSGESVTQSATVDALAEPEDPANLVHWPVKRFNKPTRTYLTKPLRLFQLVASSTGATAAAENPLRFSIEQLQQAARVRPPRKLSLPSRRLEALDFDGQPVPTLGRVRLVATDLDESRMRWQHLCLVCHQQLQSSSQLFGHMEAHSQTLHRASKHLLGGRIRCCLCLELVPTWKRFRTHMQRHVGYQPFRCKQCAETFSTNGNLKRHIGRKHSRDGVESPNEVDRNDSEHCSD